MKAEQRLRVVFARAPEPEAPLAPQAATRTASQIVRAAAQSLIAQANVERQGATDLLLR